jgi:hypothetical protein
MLTSAFNHLLCFDLVPKARAKELTILLLKLVTPIFVPRMTILLLKLVTPFLSPFLGCVRRQLGLRGNVRGLFFNGRRPEAEIHHQVQSCVKLPLQTGVKLL